MKCAIQISSPTFEYIFFSQLFSPATAVTTAATKPHHSVGPLGRLGRATLEKAGAGQSTWNDSHVGICSPVAVFWSKLWPQLSKCQEHVRSSLCRSGALSLSEILCGMLLYLPLDSVSKHPGAMSNWSWEHVSGSWLSFPSGREPRSGARVWWCWRPLVLLVKQCFTAVGQVYIYDVSI